MEDIKIRSVNQHNLKQEFMEMKTILCAPSKTRRRFLSVDTEFPGIVQKSQDPESPKKKDALLVKSSTELNQARYDVMRESVENTKLIQLVLTVYDADKRSKHVWEFSFKGFDMDNDKYKRESIDFLKKHGVDFVKNQEEGISVEDFAREFENLLTVPRIYWLDLIWVFFHCTYDLGYLVKILTHQEPLPCKVDTFIEKTVPYWLRSRWVFDLKMMVGDRKLGLDKVAENMEVVRIGQSHQAGSDSLLTLDCFVALFDRLKTEPEKAKKLWNDSNFNLHGFHGIKSPENQWLLENFEVQHPIFNNSGLQTSLLLQNYLGPTMHPRNQSFKQNNVTTGLPLQYGSNGFAAPQTNSLLQNSYYAGSENDFPDLQNYAGRKMHPRNQSSKHGAPKSNSKKKQANVGF